MAKCPVCKQYLTGYSWTKTKNGKNWLKNNSGEWHDCPKSQGRSQKQYGWEIPYKPTFLPSFIFCGKCTHLCKDDWCSQCDMYPQVTYHGNTMIDNLGFSPDPTVKALQDSNRSQTMEEARLKYNPPSNALWMNEDGSISTGYKLTPQLTKWYEKDGKGILKELYSKIVYKKRERTNLSKG